jgi:hypothetical protein
MIAEMISERYCQVYKTCEAIFSSRKAFDKNGRDEVGNVFDNFLLSCGVCPWLV